MRAGTAVLLGTLAVLAGCKKQDMYAQGYSRNWDRNGFFANGSSMRHPVEGTVPRTLARPDVSMPVTVSAAMLERGQQRFDIFCSPCHGRAANGEGMIVQRGFPQAPSLVSGRLRTAEAGVFYDAMTNGYGAMYSFATRLSPADRWAVISYVRALQLSQNAVAAGLPAEERARLEASR